MKIVILGHRGFIGGQLYRALLRQGHQVLGFSSADCDLTDAAACEGLKPHLGPETVVIWCAAIKRQSGDSIETLEANLRISLNLARLLSEQPPARLIYLSSTAVYGEDVAYDQPIHEALPTRPVSFYGIAKDTTERLLEKCFKSCLMLRPPLVYGPGEARPSYGPNLFLQTLQTNAAELALWGDALELREFLFIDDLVAVTLALLDRPASGRLNLVSGQSHAFLEAAQLAQQLTGQSAELHHRPRTKQAVNHVFDNHALRELLPEFCFTPLATGMARTLADMKQVPAR